MQETKGSLYHLLVVSIFSGFAALTYEVLWLRKLGDIVGASAYAMHIVLTAFFLGMALGGAWSTRWPREESPIRYYLWLEGSLGLYGLLSPALFSLLGWVYTSFVPTGEATLWSLTLRSLLGLSILIIPTMLMGATLPVLVQLVDRHYPSTTDTTGHLYLWNTLGAAIGAATAGLLLPRYLGIHGGIYLAGTFNLLIALYIGWVFRDDPLRYPHQHTPLRSNTPSPATHIPSTSIPLPQLISALTLFALAGFCAISYEILWTRGLMSLLGNTIYSFSALLSTYLLGLALGGGLYTRLRGFLSFGALQWLIGLSGLTSIWLLSRLPQWQQQWLQQAQTETLVLSMELALIASVFLLPCVLMGMSFPAMLAHLDTLSQEDDTTKDNDTVHATARKQIGWVVFANTLGSVLAPWLMGMWWLPALHLRNALVLAASLNMLVGIFALTQSKQWDVRWFVVAGFGALLLLGVPSDLRHWKYRADDTKLVHYKEGIAASIAVVEDKHKRRRLKLNNRFSMGGQVGRFGELRQGHIPVLLHPNARKVLALGVATGHTLSAIASHQTLKIDAIELIPGILSLLPAFEKTNEAVYKQKNVRLLAEDARHYVASTKKRYDLIIADLFHTYKAGVGGLYTREHFEKAKKILRPGGIYFQWLPLYQLTPQALRVVIKTFSQVFPHVHGWFVYLNTHTPVLGLMGTTAPYTVRWLALQHRYKQRGMSARLRRVALQSPIHLLSMYALDQKTLSTLAKDSPLNTNNFPYLELNLPLARWKKEWKDLGRKNLRTLLSLKQPIPEGVLTRLPKSTKHAIERRRRAVSAYLYSRLYLHQGKTSNAHQALFEALAHDPSWDTAAKIATNIASSYIKKKDWSSAETFLKRLLGAVPTHHEGWFLRGNVALTQKRVQDAIRYYNRTLKLRPHAGFAIRNLAVLYIRTQQPAKAAQVLLTHPQPSKHLRLLHHIGKMLAQKRHWPALAKVAQMLVKHPKPPKRSYEMLGLALLQQQYPKKAIPYLQKAIKRQPKQVHIQIWLIQSYLKANDLLHARTQLDKSVRMFPKHPFLQTLSMKLAQLSATPPTSRPTSQSTTAPTP